MFRRVTFAAAVESRWTILLTSCVITFAQDFFQDITSVLARRMTGVSTSCMNMTDHCLYLTTTQYNAFLTAFTWSSAATAVVAALIIGRYGTRLLLWTSSGLMVLGSLLFVVGSYAETSIAYPVMISGRVLYGFGNGAAGTITGNMVSSWFIYHELGLACAINTLFGRLGSATNYLLVGGVLNRIGMSGCLWIAFALTVLAWLNAAVLGHVDHKHNKDIQPTNAEHMIVVRVVLRNLGGLFWSFCIVYFLMHGIVSTFTNNASTMFLVLENYSEAEASYVIGLVPDVSLIAPVVGLLLDRYGKRYRWLTSGAVVVFLAFVGYHLLPNFPAPLFTVTIGLGFALFDPTASSSTSLVSPQDTGGIASAILKFFRYICVSVFVTVAGGMVNDVDEMHEYIWHRFVFMLMIAALVSVAAAILMDVYNHNDPEHPLSPDKKGLELQHQQHVMADEKTPLVTKTTEDDT